MSGPGPSTGTSPTFGRAEAPVFKISPSGVTDELKELNRLPEKMQKILAMKEQIKASADRLSIGIVNKAALSRLGDLGQRPSDLVVPVGHLRRRRRLLRRHLDGAHAVVGDCGC